MNTLETLRKFCETRENQRWAITEPYAFGGFTYATDTKIAARMPGMLVENNLKPGQRFPPVTEKSICDWDNVFPLKSTHEIKNASDLKKRKNCQECNGACSYTCNCPNCNQEHACERCEGEGKVHAIEDFKIHNSYFDPRYVELILSLPKVKVFVDGYKLYFESETLQGLHLAFDK